MASIEVQASPVEENGHIVPLNSVYIDGHLVSNEFPPFDASFASIGTSTCTTCFLASGGEWTSCGSIPQGLDSHDVIGIRRHNEKIVWFHQHDEWSCPIIPDAPKHRMWHFDINEYESKLGGDSSRLPGFNSKDIQRVLQFSQIPDPNDAIYRIPLCKSDRNGKILMQIIRDMVHDDGLEIVDAPDIAIPYEIGFERNCDPEVLFDVGMINDVYAFKLNRHPIFSFWITSESTNKRFREIAG